ncbi:unnamed protein product [Ambrosiozyma monospora]|uniref:Unnamed protein product n=1 Tax=Ambrosiozyma monospora TaxID=43982 RepID=A0ACB5T229_AMBMO|nr:unnamed protein product [Ambrosiozyma monospora]
MMETSIDSPGLMVEAFGLTQYNFGAVVLTLKAIGCSELLETVIVVVDCFVKGAIECYLKKVDNCVSKQDARVKELSFI